MLKYSYFLSLSGQPQKPVCMFYFLSLTLMHFHDNMIALNACDDGMSDKLVTVHEIFVL